MSSTGSQAAPSDRVLTVPNVLSALRLLGVPLFLYWVLVTEQDGRAILLLMAAGASDYLDGKIARAWGQFSRLGQLLDPLADRLYILATLLALVARDGLPWWWAVGLISRDLFLGMFFFPMRRRGYGPPPVHFLGKAATFNLLYAFPMLLAALPDRDDLLATVFRPLGWAFATWGSTLYWYAGVLYVIQVVRLLRSTPVLPRGTVLPPDQAAPPEPGQPVAPQPPTPQPSTPQPSSPQPSTPQPSTPLPEAPEGARS